MKTCKDCIHFEKGDGWRAICIAPVPQWVEMQGQSQHVNPEHPAGDCEVFLQKPVDA